MPNKYFPLKHQNISLVVIWSSPKAGYFYFLPKKKLKYLKKDQVITKEIAAVFFENLISSQQVFQSACSSAPDQKVNLRKFYFWRMLCRKWFDLPWTLSELFYVLVSSDFFISKQSLVHRGEEEIVVIWPQRNSFLLIRSSTRIRIGWSLCV